MTTVCTTITNVQTCVSDDMAVLSWTLEFAILTALFFGVVLFIIYLMKKFS